MEYRSCWCDQGLGTTRWGSPEIIVAVIDSGIDYTHPDLVDRMWINEDEIADNSIDDDENGYVDDVNGWDFIHDDNDPIDELPDIHGTLVAGVLAADLNDMGIIGVAPRIKIMNLRAAADSEGAHSRI